MHFELVDVDGHSVFSGTLGDMRSWFLRPENSRIYNLLQKDSWEKRDDVVALHCLGTAGIEIYEHFQLTPELTRQFLGQLP